MDVYILLCVCVNAWGFFFVVGIFAGFFLLILKFIWHFMVLWEFLVGEQKIGDLEGGNCLGLIKFHDWHWTRFTLTGLHLNI